ncbi:hypothetical protein RJT34_23818 [Clitoria ternatea]|uniref:MATH domain-containing protein n=1 Tax=Clitoria ternatea TaxID=43366 RepID=A0AAN9IGX1_CLITE
MENQRENDKTFEKFTWKIERFSKLDSKKLYSESFFIDGHTWRIGIRILPKGKGLCHQYLSIYLNAGDEATLPSGWSKSATFKLSLVNQIHANETLTKGSIFNGDGLVGKGSMDMELQMATRIVIFPKRKLGRYEYLSIYLNAGDATTLPCGWSKSATFKVSLVNQIDAHMTLTKVKRNSG